MCYYDENGHRILNWDNTEDSVILVLFNIVEKATGRAYTHSLNYLHYVYVGRKMATVPNRVATWMRNLKSVLQYFEDQWENIQQLRDVFEPILSLKETNLVEIEEKMGRFFNFLNENGFVPIKADEWNSKCPEMKVDLSSEYREWTTGWGIALPNFDGKCDEPSGIAMPRPVRWSI